MAKKARIMMTTEGDVAVVSILETRILDESNIKGLMEEIDAVVDKKYLLKMVIDFKGVTHLSSAVIGKLMALYKRMLKDKREFRIAGLNPVIRQVFKVTKVDKMIEIHDDLGAAVKSFQKKKWFGR